MLSRPVFRQLTNCMLPDLPAISLRCVSCSSYYPQRSLANAARVRLASSSSTRWKSRQGKDFFAREAKVQGLKSRAAFKLLEVMLTLG